jgi:tRNA threonylcarbamoyladenosine biosynthesis protein TsaB
VNVLAIDTSGTAMAMAVATRDGRLFTAIDRAGLRHAESLAPAIAAILDRAGLRASALDLVGCSIGPGSFTGVRIGLSTAKGLAFGAGCPLVGVPTLDALAFRFAAFPALVAPVIDARKGRVYAATFRGGTRTSEYLDLAPEELARLLLREAGDGPLLLTGPHARAVHAALDAETARGAGAVLLDGGFADTAPEALLELAERRFRLSGPDPESLAPLYLRPSEAEIKTPFAGADAGSAPGA